MRNFRNQETEGVDFTVVDTIEQTFLTSHLLGKSD